MVPSVELVAPTQELVWDRAHLYPKQEAASAEGEHLMTTIDGEVVDGGEPDMKLIESDRSDGPNDRTDGPDGSDDAA